MAEEKHIPETEVAIQKYKKALKKYKAEKDSTMVYEIPKMEIADSIFRLCGIPTRPEEMQ